MGEKRQLQERIHFSKFTSKPEKEDKKEKRKSGRVVRDIIVN
jgi:hypothetical protein